MTKTRVKKAAPTAGKPMTERERLQALRNSASFFYDLQKFRVATAQRAAPPDPEKRPNAPVAALDEDDMVFLGSMSNGLELLEKQALGYVTARLKGIAIYETWLKNQKGVGPTMAAVLLSSFSIEREEYVSQMWSYAGLSVRPDGRAARRVKGEKAGYNPWLKGKLLGVLAESFIKAYSIDEATGDYVVKRSKYAPGDKKKENPISVNISLRASDPGAPFAWRSIYDGRKHKRRNMRVRCMACDGCGTVTWAQPEEVGGERVKLKEPRTCPNCNGEGIGPWGQTDAHRDADARRYMIKMFLIELHRRWRESLGLPVRASYHEEQLGHVHHARVGDPR